MQVFDPERKTFLINNFYCNFTKSECKRWTLPKQLYKNLTNCQLNQKGWQMRQIYRKYLVLDIALGEKLFCIHLPQANKDHKWNFRQQILFLQNLSWLNILSFCFFWSIISHKIIGRFWLGIMWGMPTPYPPPQC